MVMICRNAAEVTHQGNDLFKCFAEAGHDPALVLIDGC